MHIKPKKRLGQNFLLDKNIQNKVLKSLELRPADTVLEIGSGMGDITALIAKKVKRVFAVEIDADFYKALDEKAAACGNITVIKKDILKLDLQKYFSGLRKIKVFGNIPYYISSPIITHLLKFRSKVSKIFITVQKEFAKRVVAYAGSKDYGSLSCFVRYFSEPSIMLEIKKNSFFPAPKVDSCLLRLSPRQKTELSKSREKLLFEIIRGAFNQRRKTLRNSLKNIVPAGTLKSFLSEYSIDINARPETLSLQDFINLAKH